MESTDPREEEEMESIDPQEEEDMTALAGFSSMWSDVAAETAARRQLGHDDRRTKDDEDFLGEELETALARAVEAKQAAKKLEDAIASWDGQESTKAAADERVRVAKQEMQALIDAIEKDRAEIGFVSDVQAEPEPEAEPDDKDIPLFSILDFGCTKESNLPTLIGDCPNTKTNLEQCQCPLRSRDSMKSLQAISLGIDDIGFYDAKVSGFVALRDYVDFHRIYLFRREKDNPARVSLHLEERTAELPMTLPKRATNGWLGIVCEYDIVIESLDGERKEVRRGYDEWMTQSFPANVYHFKPDEHIYFRCSVFFDAIEARVEIKPVQVQASGLRLRLTARPGRKPEKRFDNKITIFDYQSNGRIIRREDLKKKGNFSELSFVLSVPMKETLELNFVLNNVPHPRFFEPKVHGCKSDSIDGPNKFSIKVSWCTPYPVPNARETIQRVKECCYKSMTPKRAASSYH